MSVHSRPCVLFDSGECVCEAVVDLDADDAQLVAVQPDPDASAGWREEYAYQACAPEGQR
jgi:hypothetical protein